MGDKKVWEIYVPTIRKNGKPIRTRFHRVWDKKVMAISGGLSIHRPSVGNWISPEGTHYRDRMIPVRIVATDDEIKQIIAITLKHYEDKEYSATAFPTKFSYVKITVNSIITSEVKVNDSSSATPPYL